MIKVFEASDFFFWGLCVLFLFGGGGIFIELHSLNTWILIELEYVKKKSASALIGCFGVKRHKISTHSPILKGSVAPNQNYQSTTSARPFAPHNTGSHPTQWHTGEKKSPHHYRKSPVPKTMLGPTTMFLVFDEFLQGISLLEPKQEPLF